MTLRVEIGENEGWLDHLGNPMPKLVLSKEHKSEFEYEAGYYPLESFGELYRSLDSIPERPVQKLTSWTISLRAGYSFRDSDGKYKSVPDLLYFLEALNEDKNKELSDNGIEFDIVGKAAVLYDDAEKIFAGMVESVASSGGKISISISERIGAPSIPKSEIAISLGNNNSYLPVKIAKNHLGIEEIVISQTLVKLDGLYIYSEARDEYIKARFGHAKFDGKKIIFLDENPIAYTDIAVSSGEPFFVGEDVRKELEIGQQYYIGKSGNEEIMEIWNEKVANSDCATQLKRSSNIGDHSYHPINDPIRKAAEISDRFLLVDFSEYGGEKLTLNSIEGFEWRYRVNEERERDFVYGNPSFFLNNSSGIVDELNQNEINEQDYAELGEPDYKFPAVRPAIYTDILNNRRFDEKYHTQYIPMEHSIRVKFALKLKDIDLPSSAQVTAAEASIFAAFKQSIRFDFAFHCNYQLGGLAINDFFHFHSELLQGEFFTRKSGYYDFDRETYNESKAFNISEAKSFSDMRTALIDLTIYPTTMQEQNAYWYYLYGDYNPSTHQDEYLGHMGYLDFYEKVKSAVEITLYGIKHSFTVRIPFTDAKLYAKVSHITPPPDSGSDSNSNGGNSVVPAIKSLLSATEARGYEVWPEGDLPDIKYGTFLQNESAKFRDKLGSLSAAASAIVRFDSVRDTFMVKSISRENELEQAQIPLDAILLKNNFYDFKMETPERMDIHTGIEISWGKNSATGKYENKTFIDTEGIKHNGKKTGKDTSKWTWLFDKLGKTKKTLSDSANIKIIENEWIIDEAGAEGMAYNYLSWSCAPFRKAEIGCIKSQLPEEIDIGSLVCFNLPGYPEKLARTSWLVTAMTDDLDSGATSLQLLEMLGVEAVPEERFLLTEDGQPFLTEDTEEGIKLEA